MLETPNTTTKARLRIVLVDRVIAVGHLQGFSALPRPRGSKAPVHRKEGSQRTSEVFQDAGSLVTDESLAFILFHF